MEGIHSSTWRRIRRLESVCTLVECCRILLVWDSRGQPCQMGALKPSNRHRRCYITTSGAVVSTSRGHFYEGRGKPCRKCYTHMRIGFGKPSPFMTWWMLKNKFRSRCDHQRKWLFCAFSSASHPNHENNQDVKRKLRKAPSEFGLGLKLMIPFICRAWVASAPRLVLSPPNTANGTRFVSNTDQYFVSIGRSSAP